MAASFANLGEYAVVRIFVGALSDTLRIFPVYFMRLKFAAPLIVAQSGLLLLISAIFSHLPKRLA